MIAKRMIIYSVSCVLLLGSFLSISQTADAASGSITIAPGETKYLSFGACASGDVVLWSLEISTLSTILEYWLQAPDGSHLPLYSLTWGKVVDAAGEWRLGFSIDISGWWSATVYYTTYRTTPQVEITGPLDSTYVNQALVTVSGTTDGFADSVAVSLDDVHYDSADLYLGSWNKQVTLTADGDYTIYAEAALNWGSFVLKYYDSVTITLDRLPPEVVIKLPADDGLVRGNYVDIVWAWSDDSGIETTEINIDGWGWSAVTGSRYDDLRLATGEHTIQIRVTDIAGNQATDSTTFTVDARVLSFDGPYYGVPLIGIILAVVIAAVATITMVRRRRGSHAPNAAEELPEEPEPEEP